jgi:hypothetical protein
MARKANLNMNGSVRVVQDADPTSAAFVAGTNNGAFAAITPGVLEGDATIDLDDDYRLAEADVVEGQIEGDALGSLSIERVSQSQIRVRTYNAAGYNAAKPYSLNLTNRYVV